MFNTAIRGGVPVSSRYFDIRSHNHRHVFLHFFIKKHWCSFCVGDILDHFYKRSDGNLAYNDAVHSSIAERSGFSTINKLAVAVFRRKALAMPHTTPMPRPSRSRPPYSGSSPFAISTRTRASPSPQSTISLPLRFVLGGKYLKPDAPNSFSRSSSQVIPNYYILWVKPTSATHCYWFRTNVNGGF